MSFSERVQQSTQGLKQWLPLAPWLLIVVLLLLGIFGDQGILQLRTLHQEQQRMEAALHEQERLHQELRRQVRQLQSNTRHLERMAREEMGYVRPGELVYQFQD